MSDHEPDARRRRLVDSVIPEMIKRVVERGVERAQNTPGDLKSFLHDLKVPKEIAHYVLSQVDETKNGLFRVVGSEVRGFLEQTNFSGELQKILTTVQFEVNTTIRFTPNKPREGDEAGAEGAPEKLGKPDVRTRVHVRREEKERRRRARIERRAAEAAQAKGEPIAPIPPTPRVPTPSSAAPESASEPEDEDRNDD